MARLDGMPLAIELAAARVEALGVAQLLDRLDDRFALLAGGDRLAPGRQRSLAATVEWSYQLLDEQEQRVFRAVSVFPGPFTLEAAEAVAGPGAGPAVLRLVDCSLLVPPRAGPDGRSRYAMLETLRAYGAGLLAEAGEQDGAAAALAGYALRVAEAGRGGAADQRPGSWPRPAGWMPRTPRCGRCWPGPWTTTRPWRCGWRPRWAGGGSCGAGWRASTRCCARPPGAPSRAATGGAPRSSGSAGRRMFSADLAGALGHFTAVRDAVAGPGAVPGAGRLPWPAGRWHCGTWAGSPRRPTMPAARWPWPGSSATRPARLLALGDLSLAAYYAGDHDERGAAGPAGRADHGRHPRQVARMCSYVLTAVLIDAGDLAAAERVCAAALARARDAGDLWNQAVLLPRMADLDLRAGRIEDAAAHLREGLQLAVRTGSWLDLLNGLDRCGTCAPRPGAPPRPSRCGPRTPRCPARGNHRSALVRAAGRNRCARPGRRSDPPGRGRPRNAARR